MTPVRLEPAAIRSRFKHSTTELPKTDEELLKHKQSKHSHTFLCRHCGMSSKKKRDLNYHLATMHDTGSLPTKECPFDYCTKTFAKERSYQDHINKHIGVKPHVCKSCLKSFYTSAYFAEHTKADQRSQFYLSHMQQNIQLWGCLKVSEGAKRSRARWYQAFLSVWQKLQTHQIIGETQGLL